MLAVFVVVGGILRNALGIEWSTEGVRAMVADAGVWAPILFTVLLVFRLFLVIPSALLLPAGGLLFGVVEGSIYGTIGLTISSLVNYGLVWWAGPEAFRARISPRFLGVLDIVRSRGGAIAVVVITAYPFGPITAAHLGAAVAGMRFVTYLLAVATGSLVRSATFAFFGAAIVDSDQLGIASLVMLGALVIPLLIPHSRAWLMQTFGASTSREGLEDPSIGRDT
jgi:uncharacterized membrane protein YdjX (TVP38/TMEM64 family)